MRNVFNASSFMLLENTKGPGIGIGDFMSEWLSEHLTNGYSVEKFNCFLRDGTATINYRLGIVLSSEEDIALFRLKWEGVLQDSSDFPFSFYTKKEMCDFNLYDEE